jgi:hypothetical protein
VKNPYKFNKTELHVLWFDPGGITGWAYSVVSSKAFSHPREYVLKNLLEWRTGEFEGTEHEQATQALDLIRRTRYSGNVLLQGLYEVGTEDFELTQLIGGKELLGPVRLNAVLDYQVKNLFGLDLLYQNRSMRTGVTRPRMKLWKLPKVQGKDAFAAAQHNLTFLKRVKIRADEITWKRYQRQGMK